MKFENIKGVLKLDSLSLVVKNTLDLFGLSAEPITTDMTRLVGIFSDIN